jgi:hypothetical protein
MKPTAKVGIVVTGYVAASAAGGVAGHLYDVRMAAQPYDTSGGMYAGGEMMAELAAFLPVALVPTLLALWFLRDHRGVWTAVGLASLAFALAGLAGVLMPRGVMAPPRPRPRCAPAGPPRRTMIAAVAFELANAACAAVHWMVPRPPL